MLRPVMLAAFIAVSTTLAYAQTDATANRIKAMKQVGEATKPLGEMLKGAEPFDLAKVQTALALYQSTSKSFPSLFPEDSKTGKDSTAAPSIWQNKTAFDTKIADWGKASADAASKIKDEASFKAEIKTVLGSCKACHDEYRIKK